VNIVSYRIEKQRGISLVSIPNLGHFAGNSIYRFVSEVFSIPTFATGENSDKALPYVFILLAGLLAIGIKPVE
jgi:hypothetical protein